MSAAKHNKWEQRNQTHSGFCKKIAPECGEMKVYPDVDDEVGEEQVMSIIDGGIGAGKAPACDKYSAAGR